MESVSIKRRKKEYIFSPQEIVIKKNGQILRVVHYDEINKIRYNSKFGLSDIFILIFGKDIFYSPNAFVIEIKHLNDKWEFIRIKIHKSEFERIKGIISMPIEII